MLKVRRRHLDNPSPFALAPVGAVARQGISFREDGPGEQLEKGILLQKNTSVELPKCLTLPYIILQVDWLHSPSAEHTVS
jgi:hypothetical protein